MPLVIISNDVTMLGDSATREDLDTFKVNLAAHLSEQFGRTVEVQAQQVYRARCSDSEIENYVDELFAGDGWIHLLPDAIRAEVDLV